MKNNYLKPQMEVLMLDAEDVVRTSNPGDDYDFGLNDPYKNELHV